MKIFISDNSSSCFSEAWEKFNSVASEATSWEVLNSSPATECSSPRSPQPPEWRGAETTALGWTRRNPWSVKSTHEWFVLGLHRTVLKMLNHFKTNNMKLTSASSSLDENCPVVPMIIFLIQNDPSWNLQRRKEYILCLSILWHAFTLIICFSGTVESCMANVPHNIREITSKLKSLYVPDVL